MKKLMMAVVAACAAVGAYAEFTIGTSNDPKAGEVDLGRGLYCLVFSNGSARAWTFTPRFPVRVEKLLVVGGGGGGGTNCGGGGGGGAVNSVDFSELPEAERPAVSEEISLVVGVGGAAGAQGGESRIELGGEAYFAYGGGGGGTWSAVPQVAAEAGKIASGGGSGNGGAGDRDVDGSCYNSLYGNPGGGNAGAVAGGGGGAGERGGNGGGGVGGKGGIGVTNDITGVAHLYGTGGCGGQGSQRSEPWEGGGYGGKYSGSTIEVGGTGTDGLGGGGGGGASQKTGGWGGSGCVCLLVQVLNDGKVLGGVTDYLGIADGEEHAVTLLPTVPANAAAKWATAAEGPFELDEPPTFGEVGVHDCWVRLSAPDYDDLVLKGSVRICPVEPTSIDIGVCSDATCFQREFGDGLYLLGFTNVTAEAITFVPNRPCRIERMLLVGGGGAGGYDCGGGGGGGGVTFADYWSLDEEKRPVVSSALSVLVGRGAPRTASQAPGENGGHTRLAFGETVRWAYGGGGGGGWGTGCTPRSAFVAGEIGSGGGVGSAGAGSYDVDTTGYNSTQGNPGGRYASGGASGGGGGARDRGEDAAGNVGGKGGIGFACDISGETHLYGTGGSGGYGTSAREAWEGGGTGGGRTSGPSGGAGVNGLGGGGGGAATGSYKGGGAGGSGCAYLLVRVIESREIVASMTDYIGIADGEAHVSDLTVATPGTTVMWSTTGETGPFDLVDQPGFAEPGIHTNWCEISAAGKDTRVLRGVVMLRSADGDYYVTPGGDDERGLGTAELPFASIARALAWAKSGCTVRLAPATYTEIGLVVDKSVTIAGDDANPGSCVIDGNNSGQVIALSDEGARLTGLTVRGGNAVNGANVMMSAGVVSNCVITGGVAVQYQNCGGNVYLSGGLVVDSQILKGRSFFGAGAYVTGSGRILRCRIKGNASDNTGGGVMILGDGVVENSLIAGNSALWGAGVQLQSANAWLVNCTVTGNTGSYGSGAWLESNGNTLNSVITGGYVIKSKGAATYCALGSEPTRESGAIAVPDGQNIVITNNVPADAGLFKETTDYRPKSRTALNDGGSDAGYAAHAISATDYAGGPRFLGRHINIGHFELPPPPGFMLMLK